MSEKIYLISHLRANPRRRTLLRVALAASLAAGLLAGLAACSPRLPAGSAGAAAEPTRSVSGPAGAASGKAPSTPAGGAATGRPAASAQTSGKGAAAARKKASSAGGRAGARQASSAQGVGSSANSTAYVNYVRGEVSSSSPAAKHVRVADTVGPGELITTRKGSAVEIRVGGLFDIGLGENASLRFDRIDAGAGAERRLVLTLQRGALQIEAGAAYVAGGSAAATTPVILEVHTPHLFVSSRGGSLLVTEEIDSTLCAVGRGHAWLLPESVVYANLVKAVENPTALKQLDSILSRAVGVGKHEEITVPGTRLEKIDTIGAELRTILSATKGEKSYQSATDARFKKLAAAAAQGVASAIGKPTPLSKALRAELDPQSVHHQKMQTVSSIETGPSKPAAPTAKRQTTSAASQPDVAHTPGYIPPSPPSASPSSPAAATTGAPSSSTSRSGSPTSSTATTSTSGAPSSSTSTTSTSSSSAAATSAAGAVGSLLSNLFGGSSSGTSSGSAPGGGSNAGTSNGGVPGPTPPTPPTPPTAP